MANPNALVDFVAQAARPGEIAVALAGRGQPVNVVFQGGRSAVLDLSTHQGVAWAEVIESLRRDNLPAYVEINPATSAITTLLAPIAVKVGAIHETDSGIEVELLISSARHYLRRANPDYDRLLAALRSARDRGAPVAVTESPSAHEIIDVTPLPATAVTMAPMEATPPVIEGPSPAVSVTMSQAQQMFDMVATKNCCPGIASAPCIPFTYPDDGCWGRAHEMCRLMIASGITPNKIWIYGSPHPNSQNHPNCQVYWGWHVAPTLDVTTGGGVVTYVIDPSLCDGPVPTASWKTIQLDPNAALIASPASVFYRNQAGTVVQTDPTYAQTNAVLNNYRNQLKLRATGTAGPPPYPNCMPARPGVQFTGVLAPGATGSWFTYNWPASWHVVWTMMPLTVCWGTPAISWDVQVERATATAVTYWLVVKNLTQSPVRFEGRYDIVSR